MKDRADDGPEVGLIRFFRKHPEGFIYGRLEEPLEAGGYAI